MSLKKNVMSMNSMKNSFFYKLYLKMLYFKRERGFYCESFFEGTVGSCLGN